MTVTLQQQKKTTDVATIQVNVTSKQWKRRERYEKELDNFKQ